MNNSYEFGKTSDGQTVNAYTIENINGIRVEFLNYGCILRQFWVPKSDDSYVNIVFGLDSVQAYEQDKCWFGRFVGRFANRIRNSEFELNGKTYKLEPNDGPNHLHGVFCDRIFDAQPLPARTLEEAMKGVIFTYHSPDGEDGFPGNVDVKVTYKLDDDDVLHMDYEAVSDQDTVLNFTNHSYFYLGADQKLTVNADRFLEIGSDILPTGNILNVSDYPEMDLRTETDVDSRDTGLGFYDHCYVLNDQKNNQPDIVLSAAGRGIKLEICTSEPGVQIYSGNPVGIAIEPEMYPCAPNFPEFPSSTVKAGEIRTWKNSYKIIVDF